ncbi:MAG TPA: AAA family ATPase [Solirubrobacteraceae bacterium]|nr:AAA family ATPase [Solirubrobacteraceae bacterium]
MPEPLRIGLCGGLAVEFGGSRIEADLAGRQGREVFAYLALHRGRAVSRDELAALLWPERPPRAPEASLNTILARLRRVLGPAVLAPRAQLTLDLPPGSWVDVEAAQELAAGADALLADGSAGDALELAQAGFQLVAAPLLPELQHPWVEQRRGEVDDVCSRLLVSTVRAGLAVGGAGIDDAERAAMRLVEREPFRESGYGLLMDVHAARGDVAEALLVYERLRALLQSELGIPPSPRIAARHGELLQVGAEVGGGPGRAAIAAERAQAQVPLAEALVRGSRSRLVGRERELGVIRERWSALAPNARGVIALSGEPGIGKTTLASTFAREVFAAGATVLYGQAHEDAVIPYAPVVEVLRSYVGHTPELGAEPELQFHLRELAWLIPELASHRSDQRRAPGDARLDRVRLHQAVAVLVERIASRAPTLLVFEDMHWADADTVAMLRQLLREGTRHPILPLVTYQDGEVTSDHPLARMLHDARRDLGVTRLTLHGLDEHAVGQLLESEERAPAEFARRLCEHTSGNPFFVEEIIRSLRSARVGAGAPTGAGEEARAGARAGELDLGDAVTLPDGIDDVIQDRIRRLEAPTRDALAVAAVLGQRLDLEVLEETAGDGAVGVALDSAVQAGLMLADSEAGGRYRFRHGLARQAIYRAIGHGRRTNLHLRAARALERRRQTAKVEPAEIAHHFVASDRSEVAEEAIAYSREAAERAAAAHAYADAREHLCRALGILERHRANDVASRCALLLALGKVGWQSSGPRARATFEQALSVARRSPEASHFAEATLGLGGRFYAPTGPDGPYIELLEEAVQATADDERLRTRILARLGEHLIFVDPERAERLGQEALLAARRIAEAGLLASTLLGRHATLLHVGHADERLGLAREAVEIARAGGEQELEALANHWRLYDLFESGDVAAAAAAVHRQQELADAVAQPLYRHSALVWQRALDVLAGDFERAAQLAAAALNLAQGAQGEAAKTHFAAQELALVPFCGGAERLLDAARLRAAAGDPLWSAGVCYLHAYCDEDARARPPVQTLSLERLAELPGDVFWLSTIALTAEACTRPGDEDRAHLVYELLEPYAGRCAQLIFNASFGSVHGPLGRLAATLGRPRLAAEHLEAAVDRHAAMGAAVLEARACCEFAEALQSGAASGSGREAAALAERAAALAEAHGAPRILERARRLMPVASL